MDFSSIMKYVRKELGISQEEMAHALKISFATINRREPGKLTQTRWQRMYSLPFVRGRA